MTWGKALPVLLISGVFDLLRVFFVMFWFFGPALAGVVCTSGVNSYLNTSVAETGGKVVAAGCSAAGAVGYVGAAPIAMFGVVMAMAVGLLGWLTVGMILVLTNIPIFKENASGGLLMLLGLGMSQIPFINSLPALTGTIIKLYHTQIAKEKESLRQWRQTQAQMANHSQQIQLAQYRRARAEQEILEAEYIEQEEVLMEEAEENETQQAA